MDLYDKQRRHLKAVTGWAEKMRRSLGPILEVHGDRVHFRPASKGVAMIGLLPDRPQRGKSGLRDLDRAAREFENLFAQHCRDVSHGRITGEKALQSFLISEAYKNGRKLAPINAASKETDEPVELLFVTDEIPVPTEEGKIVCDILALRVDGGRSTPVVMEVKDSRQLKRLVEQVDEYAGLLDDHAEHFEALYGAVLGKPIRFDNLAEKWIVWPAVKSHPEPREKELAEKGIRCVGYELLDGSYRFRLGIDRPTCPSCHSTQAVVPIIYGEPGRRISLFSSEGKLALGGCIVHDDEGTWRCKSCKRDFGPHFWPRSPAWVARS